MNMKKADVVIVAAGTGVRFGTGLPKQYGLLAGKPVIRHSIESFMRHPLVNRIQVVIHPDHQRLYTAATHGLDIPPPVMGGVNRQASVLNGLQALPDSRYVLVHDAARPWGSPRVITDIVTALNDGKHAVVPVLPVTDTLKKIEGQCVTATIPRENVYRVQTPQGFVYTELLALHKQQQQNALTDDAGLFEETGKPVYWVEGDVNSFKITHAHDLQKAEILLKSPLSQPDSGVGYEDDPSNAQNGMEKDQKWAS